MNCVHFLLNLLGFAQGATSTTPVPANGMTMIMKLFKYSGLGGDGAVERFLPSLFGVRSYAQGKSGVLSDHYQSPDVQL